MVALPSSNGFYTLYIAALSFQNGSSISPSSNGFYYTFSLYLIHSCFIFSKWMLYLHKLAALSFQNECFITYKWLLYSLKMLLSSQNSCISLSKRPLLSNEIVTFSYQSCFLFARIVQLLSFYKISLSAQLPSCSVSMKMLF